MRDLACSDCVVSVLISISDLASTTPGKATREEISSAELSAISTLSEKGLVPPLRFHA